MHPECPSREQQSAKTLRCTLSDKNDNKHPITVPKGNSFVFPRGLKLPFDLIFSAGDFTPCFGITTELLL